MTAEQLVDAILKTQSGHCDWTKHGTRADDGRYKTECNKCIAEARHVAIEIIAREIEAATRRAANAEAWAKQEEARRHDSDARYADALMKWDTDKKRAQRLEAALHRIAEGDHSTGVAPWGIAREAIATELTEDPK